MNSIVVFELLDEESGSKLIESNAGSAFSRWFFYWSDDGALWVYSGDIGSCLWTKDKTGRFASTFVTPENQGEMAKIIPDAFFERMSSSMRKRLEPLRE